MANEEFGILSSGQDSISGDAHRQDIFPLDAVDMFEISVSGVTEFGIGCSRECLGESLSNSRHV